MTFLDATKEVLNSFNNLPMSSNEIWKEIEKRKLLNSKGKTPWASLNTLLLYNSENSTLKLSSKTKIFEIIGKNPMKFRLIVNSRIEEIDNDVNFKKEIIKEEVFIEKILLYQVTSKSLDWKTLSVYNNNENIEYVIDKCEEYTYVMEDIAHATLKIGKTKNDPEARLNQLKTGNPSISILHVFPSTQYSESNLHERFNDFQKDLEWFFYSKGLKNFLSLEIKKHESIITSFLTKQELNNEEQQMLNFIKIKSDSELNQ